MLVMSRRRACPKAHFKKCNNRGHNEEKCYTNLDRRRYSEQRATGRDYRNMRQNDGYGTHNDFQRTRREGWTNNKGYMAYVEDFPCFNFNYKK